MFSWSAKELAEGDTFTYISPFLPASLRLLPVGRKREHLSVENRCWLVKRIDVFLKQDL